jgi:OHCU decarboxylase
MAAWAACASGADNGGGVRLERLNALPSDGAERELLACCGSREWARRVSAARPFDTVGTLLEVGDRAWRGLLPADWLEAFAAHPQIGDRSAEEEPAGSRARSWASGEQAGALGADKEVLARLAARNREYRERFGYIFIVCATGKSASEMLGILEARLGNEPQAELGIAAEEQRKITALRLRKLLDLH